MNFILAEATTIRTPMILAIIAFIIAALLLASAVVLFIKFKIPALINDLSGKAAQKRIQEMRAQGTTGGAKVSYRPSPVRANNPVNQPGNVSRPQAPPPATYNPADHTGYTDDMQVDLPTDEMTTQLDGALTSNLGTGAMTTASLDFSVDGGTEVLEQGTAVLSPDQIRQSIEANKTVEGFKITQSIVLIHTDETI